MYSYRVNVDEHNGELGQYYTHIYAYDKCGNISVARAVDQNVYTQTEQGVYLEDTVPTISDVEIIDITPTSYTIKCKVSDSESGINRVQFPTWTLENGQDDIQYSWQIESTASGVIENDVVTYTVKIDDHNAEKGIYRTHIYAFDNCGNAYCYGKLEDLTLPDYGDVNADKQFAVTDAIMLQKYILNAGNVTNWQAGDLNNDGILDIFDLALLKRMLIKK